MAFDFLQNIRNALLAAIPLGRATDTNQVQYAQVVGLIGADGANIASGGNPIPTSSTISLGASVVVDATASATGITSTSRKVSSAASTNATSVKASAGRVYAIQGFNNSAAIAYLKIYAKASAPTVGTDIPVKTFAIPPSTAFAFDWALGLSIATGIAYAITAGSADADATAIAAGDILGLNIDYV